MSGYEDRYEDRSSSRKHSSRGFEQDMSRMRESKRDRGRDRERHHRENHKDRKDDRGRDRYEDNDHHHSRNNGRYQDNDHNRDRRHGHSFLSKERSRNRSRSRSHSPAKSKRTSGFDMAPPGATVLPSAAVAGELPNVPQPMTGLFTPMVPLAAQQFGSFPMMPAQSMTQQATRHARRVYVGGLPPMANEQTIATFFSQIMSSIGGNSAGQGDAVVNVYINHEKKFAFVEMRSVEEASNAMALDGIIFEGVSVRVRRPTDYNPSLAATLGPSQPSPYLNLAAVGLTPGALGGAEGPERIFVGGLPYYFTDGQIRELLESFGPLRGFDIVKDRDTGNSKGYGFCVYQDPSVTDIACAALNGLKMGDKTLTVRRATASTGQARPEQELILQQAQHIALQKIVLQTGSAPSFPGIGSESISPVTYLTKIVCLTEMVMLRGMVGVYPTVTVLIIVDC
ncbi:splicing factor U2af large subunit A-like isoform X2 [Asparagus officinalis]|uniref:splicing factor U2af large subunit A-like isoform X2 n=1 Tax=Asparagus officinalis TaxID=4686 RepID=UPI00098E5D79|nr:splicing factor U2af large subunit A-like isoform X2 [Asparagus officinalis]